MSKEIKSSNRTGQKFAIALLCIIIIGCAQSVKKWEGGFYHTVQKGETLSQISIKYSIPIDDLAVANNIKLQESPLIYEGQKIFIPKKDFLSIPIARQQKPSSHSTYHIVAKGETLYKISQIYGVGLDDLVTANSIKNPTQILVGQKLKIPGKMYAKTEQKTIQSAKTIKKYHKVKNGDTLYNIGQKYNVEWQKIKLANPHLKSDSLIVGSVLTIPIYVYDDASEEIGKKQVQKIAEAKAEKQESVETTKEEVGKVESYYIGAKPEDSKSGFIWPLNGSIKVISPFGIRNGQMHKGIDLSAAKGTDIFAASDGIVTFAGKLSGYGNVIIINHGNRMSTVYAHNDRNISRKGEKVRKGDVIAKVGSTGRAECAHLHFEIRRNVTEPVDPIKYLPTLDNSKQNIFFVQALN